MFSTATRVAPEMADFSPALLPFLPVREFERGTDMKMRSSVLNLKAVKNHLGLSRWQLNALSEQIGLIDPRKQTLRITEARNGDLLFEADPYRKLPPRFPWRGKMSHGLCVVRSLSDDLPKEVGYRMTVPWDLVLKGAPDKGHLVYLITLNSVAVQKASLELGGPVIPHEKLMLGSVARQKEKQLYNWELTLDGRQPTYVGKTSQGMSVRFKQHINSMVRGSRTMFHLSMAGVEGRKESMLPSMLAIDSADSSDKAYALEEAHIRSYQNDPNIVSLNSTISREMIAEFLKEFPELRNDIKSIEQAEELLEARKAASRASWDDPDYAEAVICNNENNFDSFQVRQIRMMHRMGSSSAQIANGIGVTQRRVDDLLTGKKYSRVI